MKKHDEHYSKMTIEPVEISEQILTLNLGTNNIDSKQAYNMCKAVEYIMRCGLKDNQEPKKELEKAINHLHRAVNGCWIGEKQERRCQTCKYRDNSPTGCSCRILCEGYNKWEAKDEG